MEQTQSESQRPLTVIVAIACVAVALAGAPLSWAFTAQWHQPAVPFLFAGLCLLLFLPVRALYRRRNWARWLVIVGTAVSLYSVPALFREFTVSFAPIRSLIQLILYFTATILLLCPSSRRWFSFGQNREASVPPDTLRPVDPLAADGRLSTLPKNLTPKTMKRLAFLFAEESREEAASLLDRECSRNLPGLETASPADLERFHFAALKLSRGQLPRLREAIQLANEDWRDLLVAAGFANSTEAHRHWKPRKRGKHYEGG